MTKNPICISREEKAIDALKMGDGLIIRELRNSALPPEELEYLRQSGVENPESFLKLLITIARNSYSSTNTPEYIFNQGREKIFFAINSLGVRPSAKAEF